PNGPDQPARRGAEIAFFATGTGVAHGLPLGLEIAGRPAEILSFGPAPDLPGVVRLVARVPNGFFGAGRQAVTLRVGAARSQNGVAVFVR
ncbi:MAG TPA: hypothetical protein DEH78_05735, partial [Solibacterales bacterium]|nr:hypothetical protein [Bryobacterales bacterium]